MVQLGYVSGNRMSNVQTRNVKLHARALRILMAEAGLDREPAASLLDATGGDLSAALVMTKTGATLADAKRALRDSAGVVGRAIKLLS